MHDVLAHRLSLLSRARGRARVPPGRAAGGDRGGRAAVIRETARSALQDLREVIGVLRDAADRRRRAAAADARRDPVADRGVARRGMRVQSRIDGRRRRGDGRPHGLPGRAGGPDQRPQARAGGRGRGDRGGRRRARRRGRQPPLGARRAAAQPGGSGLIGLAERVALAGGALEHGPNPRGDFVLRATLPWTAVIRVLLVDDDALVRSGLRMMLAGRRRRSRSSARPTTAAACSPRSTCTAPTSC